MTVSLLTKTICILAGIIAAIGAINWGFHSQGHNLVEKVVPSELVTKVYLLVAFAGVITLMCNLKWLAKKNTSEEYQGRRGGSNIYGNVIGGTQQLKNLTSRRGGVLVAPKI